MIQFSLVPSYFTLCSLKYMSQHPTLEHLQPVFFPHCERPRFVPLQTAGVCLYSTFELLNHLVNCHILFGWFTIGNLHLYVLRVIVNHTTADAYCDGLTLSLFNVILKYCV